MRKPLHVPGPRKTAPSAPPPAPSIIALEKRIAFDGAAVAVAAKTMHPGSFGDAVRHGSIPEAAAGFASRDASGPRDTPMREGANSGNHGALYGLSGDVARQLAGARDASPAAQPKAVVFIESDVPDIGTLIKNVDHSAQIVLLDARKDGVDAIASYLAAHEGVRDVYIFSHGSEAQLDLGSATLDAASMRGRYAGDLATIKESLAPGANILVYGCDFAEGATGDSAAHLLSRLTGAAVAASTDLTGGTALGGDFILEDKIGTITAPDILRADIGTVYDGLLAAQTTGAFTLTKGTSGTATSSATVATATTADGAVKIVVTITPNTNNSAGSLVTTSGGTFDTTAPTGAYTTTLNGKSALEEILAFGGSGSGAADGTNSATITIAYFDAKTGAAIAVTNPIIDIDRLGGSSSNAQGTTVSNSSQLTLATAGATLTALASSSSAFSVSSTSIHETVNTTLATGFVPDASGDPTKGTAAGSVQVNGTYSTLTFDWARATNSLNGSGDKIDLIFSADTAMAQNGSLTNQAASDGQAGIAIATSQAFSDPSGLPVTYSASGLPAGLSIDPSTGQITGTISHDASKNAPVTTGAGATLDGTYTVIVTATNEANNAASQTFTFDSQNKAPAVGSATANQTNKEGDAITPVNAAAAFSDPNGDPLTYTATGLPLGLTISSTGSITGTVAKNAQPGTGMVVVTATDDKGAAVSETFAWTIDDAAPVKTGTLANQAYSDGQSGIAIATAGGFSAGNPLRYSANGLPAGLSIDATTGAITGTIDHDASKNAPTTTGAGANLDGTYTIVVTATDAFGGAATQGFTIDSANAAPVLGTATANQSNSDGATITPLNAGAAFSDPNGDPLTFSSSGLPKGLSIDPNTGIISGSVASTAPPGTTYVRVLATDDKGAVTKETFTWTITDVPPTANGSLSNQSYPDAKAGISIATSGGFKSPNGLPLSYTATGLPRGLSIDSATGLITGQLDHDASRSAPETTGAGATLQGSYSVIVTASDGQGGTATQSFLLNATNQAPALMAQTPPQHGADGQTVSLDASKAFTDPNTGDTISYAAAGLPTGLAINAATGLITGTIDPHASTQGPFAVTVTATDDKGAATAETFNWSVADVPPVATPSLPNQAAPDGKMVSYLTAGGFTNPNGVAYIYSATGVPAGLSIDSSTGIISGMLDHDASKAASGGTYTIAVTASDGQGGSATNGFTLTASNQAPAVGTKTADQVSLDGGAIAPVNSGRAFADPNGDPLTFTASNLPPGLTIDPTTGIISGTVPAGATPGSYLVSVTATDDKGLSTPETFSWSINDVPPAAMGTLPDKTYYDSTTGIVIGTSAGFSDSVGNALIYLATGLPAGLSINQTTGQITGTLDHDASLNAPIKSGSGAALDGTYSVTVTATDALGGTATQRFTIDARNQAPSAGTPTPMQTNTEGDAVALDTSIVFTDPNLGDVLSYAATNLPGGLSIDPKTGLITGTIANGDLSSSPYQVTVTASDDKGASAQETFSWVTLTKAPTIASIIPNVSSFDGKSVAIDTASHFTGSGDAATTYSASNLPNGLSIDASTGQITGTLDHDASKEAASQTGSGATLDGFYTITVTAQNSGGPINQSFVLDVANQAPVASTAPYTQTVTTGQTVTAPDASTLFSDPNGDPLTFTAVGLPAGLTMDATGKVSGTIAATAAGDYSIAITATDDKGAAATRTIAMSVLDDAPTPQGSITGASYADSAASISITTATAFTSPNGLPLMFSAAGLPAGLTIDPSSGTITGQLDHDASANAPSVSGDGATLRGQYTVTVTANDGHGGTAQQVFTLAATNSAPSITIATAGQHGQDGQTVSLAAAAAFADPNTGDVLTYSATNLPTGLSIDPTSGLIHGTIDKAASIGGPYSVTVTATDDKHAATSETFQWIVDDLAPQATPPLPARAVNDGTAVRYATAGGFTNPNNVTLSYSATGLPAGLAIDTATGLISGTLDHEASIATTGGLYTVAVTVDDHQGGTATNTFLLTAANQAPVAGTTTANQANRNGDTITPVNTAAVFSDPNQGDVVAYSASNLPKGLTIDPATGVISGTISATTAPGEYYVTVTATDDKHAATPETFTWGIDDLPPLAAGTLPALTVNDGQIGVSIAAAGGFISPNGLPLTYSATGLPRGLTIDPQSGTIKGYIYHDASAAVSDGAYTVVVEASDGQGGSALQSFIIAAKNQAPTLGLAMPDQQSADGQTIALAAGHAFADPNVGDGVTYTATGLPTGLTIDTATGLISGTIDPRASTQGPFTVTVTATDDKLAATAETFTWRIADTPPTSGATFASPTIPDGTAIAPIDSARHFKDPIGLPLTYTATGLPAGLTIDPETGLVSGTLDHDASATHSGFYAVTITASDGQGGTAAQSFVLRATNQAPSVATPVPTQTSLDGETIAPLALGQGFIDPNAGDILTFTALGLPKGLSIDPATGVVSGTVDRAAPPGRYGVTVTATDDKGASSSEGFTWAIADVAPRATGVLPNQRYVDGQPGIVIATMSAFTSPNGLPLIFSATGLPPGLAIDPRTGLISGTLDRDASASAPMRTGAGATLEGTYAVMVTATDPFGGALARVFAIEVDNIAPVVVAPTPDQHGRAGQAAALDLAPAFADPTGSTLAYTATGLPPGLALDPTTGHLTGTLAPGIVSTTSYTVFVTATDAKGASVTERFSYVVEAVAPSILPSPSFDEPAAVGLATIGPADSVARRDSTLTVEASTPILTVIDQTSGGQESSQTIRAEGIVISTVNGVAPLNGLQRLDGPLEGIVRSGAATDERGDLYDRTRTGLGRGIEALSTPLDFLGASSLDRTASDLGNGTAINIETMMRDRVLTISLTNGLAANADDAVASFSVTLADGRPLPSWLRVEGKGLIIGKVPGGVEVIGLRITSTLRNGASNQRSVTIRTDRGTVIAHPEAQRAQTNRTLSSMASIASRPSPHVHTPWARLLG